MKKDDALGRDTLWLISCANALAMPSPIGWNTRFTFHHKSRPALSELGRQNKLGSVSSRYSTLELRESRVGRTECTRGVKIQDEQRKGSFQIASSAGLHISSHFTHHFLYRTWSASPHRIAPLTPRSIHINPTMALL